MGNSQMRAKRTIGVFLPLFISAVLLILNYSGCEKHNPIVFEGQLSGAKILLRLPDLDKPSQVDGNFDITLTVNIEDGGSTVHEMEVKDYNVQGNLEVPAEKYLWIEAEAEIDAQPYRGESDTLFLSPGKLATVMITLDPAIGPTPNHPPNPPSNPHPPDGATDQPLNVTLSWSCSDPDSGDVLIYDVYFGSDSIPPLVSSGQSETTYDPPGNLERDQTYYWKIVAMDSHYDQTAGPIWSFGTAADSVVVFADPNLEQAVRDYIGKPTGEIFISDVDTIIYFKADSANIQSLEGLEYFAPLNFLSLWQNQISDIAALQNLTQLTSLGLSENQISDITRLQSLTQLSGLGLSENQISDITPLENLTQLNWLTLYENQISDITPLENLTQLTWLYLWDNQISDITPLQNLTQLESLDLGDNQITDITPLQSLTQLSGLSLLENQISDIAALENLTQLYWLVLLSNQISDITPLQNLTQLTWLYLDDNQISDLTPLQNLTQVTALYLWRNQISDITPLWNLTQLTDLNLDDNLISDITPLQNLTQLIWLDLGYNQIEDILPLVNNSGMDDGDEVWLNDNPLSDTSLYNYIPQLEARGVTVYY